MKKQKHLIKKICQTCGKEFEVWPCFVNRRVSCSFICGKKARIGKKQSKETIKKRVESRRGYHPSAKTKSLIGIKNSGELNGGWRGNLVSYTGIHNWIKYNKTKPPTCENCGKVTLKLDATNIYHTYKRDLNDWKFLCRSCHMKNDFRMGFKIQTGWKKRERNLLGQFMGIEVK